MARRLRIWTRLSDVWGGGDVLGHSYSRSDRLIVNVAVPTWRRSAAWLQTFSFSGDFDVVEQPRIVVQVPAQPAQSLQQVYVCGVGVGDPCAWCVPRSIPIERVRAVFQQTWPQQCKFGGFDLLIRPGIALQSTSHRRRGHANPFHALAKARRFLTAQRARRLAMPFARPRKRPEGHRRSLSARPVCSPAALSAAANAGRVQAGGS